MLCGALCYVQSNIGAERCWGNCPMPSICTMPAGCQDGCAALRRAMSLHTQCHIKQEREALTNPFNLCYGVLSYLCMPDLRATCLGKFRTLVKMAVHGWLVFLLFLRVWNILSTYLHCFQGSEPKWNKPKLQTREVYWKLLTKFVSSSAAFPPPVYGGKKTLMCCSSLHQNRSDFHVYFMSQIGPVCYGCRNLLSFCTQSLEIYIWQRQVILQTRRKVLTDY